MTSFRGKNVGGGEILTHCPRCAKQKLYLNVYRRVGFCQRCGLSLGPRDMQDGLIAKSDREVLNLRSVPSLVDAWKHAEARAYLQSRGVHPDDEYVLYDPAGRRLYFRITSPSPEYGPSYHTRSIDPKGGWVCFPGTKKQHYLWAYPTPTQQSRVMLVEGIWDAIAVGPGTVALLGTKMSDTILHYLVGTGVKPWIWLDPDRAGIEASVDIMNRLSYAGLHPVLVQAEHEPSEAPPVGRVTTLMACGWMRP